MKYCHFPTATFWKFVNARGWLANVCLCWPHFPKPQCWAMPMMGESQLFGPNCANICRNVGCHGDVGSSHSREPTPPRNIQNSLQLFFLFNGANHCPPSRFLVALSSGAAMPQPDILQMFVRKVRPISQRACSVGQGLFAESVFRSHCVWRGPCRVNLNCLSPMLVKFSRHFGIMEFLNFSRPREPTFPFNILRSIYFSMARSTLVLQIFKLPLRGVPPCHNPGVL